MEIRISYWCILLLLCGVLNANAQQHSFIPAPVSVKYDKGSFNLGSKTVIITKEKSDLQMATLLSKRLTDATGYSLKNQIGFNEKNSIEFKTAGQYITRIGDEGYLLDVNQKNILITANKPAGWFYAIETLMQLLPASVENVEATVREKKLSIPCIEIEDYPRFKWRGLMVDVSRHFFSKEVIKSYINQMSKYKLNTLHLHLTDNQGWRIEVKGLPELTKVGAWRVPRTGYWKGFKAPQPNEKASYGGYYSNEDIREIVDYGRSKQVTIVPEIDVPGHSLALIASYPNLSCTQTPQKVLAGDPWNVSRTNVLCVGNDSVYTVLDQVFTEIARLFPGEYIHVGGDEVTRGYWEKCAKCQKVLEREQLSNVEELQSYFLKRVAKIVESKGKKVITWYENLEGGMAPGSAVMSWKSYEGGILSSQKGHRVVMTPARYTYLDFYQGDPFFENGPFSVSRLSDFYQFEPIQKGVDEKFILGGQGSLWTEQVPNERKLQYMTWPRSFALAEILWSSSERREWDDFVLSLEKHLPRLDEAQVKYSNNFYEPIITGVKDKNGVLKVKITTEVKGLNIHYSFDDTSPDNFYAQYDGTPLTIPEGAHHIRVISYKNGKPAGREMNLPLTELQKRL